MVVLYNAPDQTYNQSEADLCVSLYKIAPGLYVSVFSMTR